MYKILESFSDFSDIYIYGCGIVGKWIATSASPNFRGFIETDRKKSGLRFGELEVFNFEDIKATFNANTLILVTVADIADVAPKLKALNGPSWIAAGSLLSGAKVLNNRAGESDDFVQYAVETVVNCHNAYLDSSKVFLRSVDLMITEKCSLKCKDCSNLMQFYEQASDVSFAEVISDFDDLIAATDDIHEIRLIGGEPFMSRDIYRVISKITASPKVQRLVVYSNATVPLKESEVSTLSHPKIVFSLTDYGSLSKNTGRVVNFLDTHKIPYRLHRPENWTDSGVIEDFGRSEDELKTLFAECCGKNLFTISKGNLYRCPFAANAERLDAVPYDARNGVALTADRSTIRNYLYEIDFLPACQFCKGRAYSAPEITPAVQTARPIPYKKFYIAEGQKRGN